MRWLWEKELVGGQPNSGFSRSMTKRGFTLYELLVAMFLTSLITTVLVKVASMAYRVGHEEIQRGSIEARALFVAKKLREDLAETAAAGVSLKNDGSQALIQPVDQVMQSGRLLFKEMFVHWSRETLPVGTPARLARTEILSRPDAQPFTGGPYRWLPADIAALVPGTGDKTSMVVDGVTRFEVKNALPVAPPLVGSLLGFELELELPIAATRRSIKISDAVQIRNGGG